MASTKCSLTVISQCADLECPPNVHNMHLVDSECFRVLQSAYWSPEHAQSKKSRAANPHLSFTWMEWEMDFNVLGKSSRACFFTFLSKQTVLGCFAILCDGDLAGDCKSYKSLRFVWRKRDKLNTALHHLQSNFRSGYSARWVTRKLKAMRRSQSTSCSILILFLFEWQMYNLMYN